MNYMHGASPFTIKAESICRAFSPLLFILTFHIIPIQIFFSCNMTLTAWNLWYEITSVRADKIA